MSDRMLRRIPYLALVVVTALLTPLPSAAQSVTERARAYLSRGALDSALTVSDSSLATDSANPELWVIKASIHAARAERDQQISALRTALARFPAYPKALIAIARAYLDSGLADSAAQYLPRHLFRPGPTQIDALCLLGRVFESQAKPDSAIEMYRRASEILDRRELLRFPLAQKQRLTTVYLQSAEGIASVWRPGVPSMFIFWADWSPQSLVAFGEIVANLKGAGINWRFVPINVSSHHPDSEAKERTVALARELGYKDTVWIDSDLSLFREWRVNRVPEVIVIELNGDIDAVESGWSDDPRELILNRYLGSYTDTVSTAASSASPARTRSRYLIAASRAAWETGNLEHAIKQATNAVKADPQFPLAHATLAAWRWHRGDTVGARLAAYNAFEADSLDQWSRMAIGRLEYLHGHEQAAFELMQRCIEKDSGLVPVWRLLGRCAIALGDSATASQAIHVIEELNKLDLGLPVLRALIGAATDPVLAAMIWRQVLDARP